MEEPGRTGCTGAATVPVSSFHTAGEKQYTVVAECELMICSMVLQIINGSNIFIVLCGHETF